jgi:hypothetical protein
MADQTIHNGMAALTICESLLLALNDRNILPESAVLGVLGDAAVTHENSVGSEAEVEVHQAVAALIRQIIAGSNSVRRP